MLQSIASQSQDTTDRLNNDKSNKQPQARGKHKGHSPTAWLITDKGQDHFHGWQPVSHCKDGGGQGIGASDELMLYLLSFLKDPQLG